MVRRGQVPLNICRQAPAQGGALRRRLGRGGGRGRERARAAHDAGKQTQPLVVEGPREVVRLQQSTDALDERRVEQTAPSSKLAAEVVRGPQRVVRLFCRLEVGRRRGYRRRCARRGGRGGGPLAEDGDTLMTANNYANLLEELNRYEEAKELVRNTMPVARRVLGESHEITLRMRSIYATALRRDPNATLDDLREAVTTYEETERTSRRVLGGAHPTTTGIEKCLGEARAVLRARETLPMSA